MCPCDLSISHKQYQENCQNHAAWVMLIFLAHFFLILLGMSLICKTANNSNSSGCWWIVTTTYWRLTTLTVGQKLDYPFGTYVISTLPRRIHRGKGGTIQPIVSLSFLEGTIDNLLQACVNFAVVIWDKVSLHKPCWPQTHGGPSALAFQTLGLQVTAPNPARAMALWESSDADPSFHDRHGACCSVISWMWTQMNPSPSQFSNMTVLSEIYTANWNHAPNFE